MAHSLARHWRSAAQALALIRRSQELTRTELGRLLGLRSGPTSDLMKRLARAELVREQPVAQSGPGRPTTTVHAHPRGPVAVVLDLRHGDWRLGTCDLDGAVQVHDADEHDGSAPDDLLRMLGENVHELAGRLGDRVVGAAVAVPGLAVDGRLSATMLDWPEVDTAPLTSALDEPVLICNDATAAGVAEARMHPSSRNPLLHVVVEVGIGGALVIDGEPAPAAHGLHGEFGHLPFGDPVLVCPCGARGCWSASFDVLEIARRTGLRPKRDPRAWLHHLYTHPRESPAIHEVTSSLAVDLGRGIAGLVNALDPGLVTLGGMADAVRRVSPTAFDQAFHCGLMKTHRTRAPQIVAAKAGSNAALIGGGLSVFDHVLDADLLAEWASRRSQPT